MDLGKYGPFADVVAVACALVATFSLMLLKALGRMKKWTWLAGDAPSFLVTGGARALALAGMAAAFVLLDQENYGWFLALALLSGVGVFVCVARFDLLRRIHVHSIPEVGPGGAPLRDSRGNAVLRHVILGTEDQMTTQARADYRLARGNRHGLSLTDFMAGYGSERLNEPTNLWSREVLARIGNRLTVLLMSSVLLAVITLFLAALIVDVMDQASQGPLQ